MSKQIYLVMWHTGDNDESYPFEAYTDESQAAQRRDELNKIYEVFNIHPKANAQFDERRTQKANFILERQPQYFPKVVKFLSAVGCYVSMVAVPQFDKLSKKRMGVVKYDR